VLEDGLDLHRRFDTPALTVQRSRGFLQRQFIADVVPAERGEGRPRGEVKERIGTRRVDALLQTASSPRRAVPPADVEISIETRDRHLHFFLTIADGLPAVRSLRRKRVGSTPLGGEFGDSPAEYHQTILNRIREIRDSDPADAEDDLKKLGFKLYSNLFPDELQTHYQGFRKDVDTLVITSEEPWIPWEMVRPWGELPSGEEWEDDFLAAQFQLTRWHGENMPRQRFEISYIAWLEAGHVDGEPPLDTAVEECSHLAKLAAARKVIDLSPEEPDVRAIEDLLRRDEDIQLWHVAAHGRLDVQDPTKHSVVLRNGCWSSTDLHGPILNQIGKARPLVFFNACLVAHLDLELGKLEGWPARWLEYRCGAFLGPQWSVDSNLASTFSTVFYDALVEGKPFGVAAREARQAVREQAPHDPTWLAYAVYGNPNAEVEFGT
jgi:hypothetical protein